MTGELVRLAEAPPRCHSYTRQPGLGQLSKTGHPAEDGRLSAGVHDSPVGIHDPMTSWHHWDLTSSDNDGPGSPSCLRQVTYHI